MRGWFTRAEALPVRDRLECSGSALDYRIRESARRRSLALELRSDGLTVAAPAGTPLAIIRHFVQSRAGWIEAHRARFAALPALLSLENGVALPLLDTTLALHLQFRPGNSRCAREGNTLRVQASTAAAARVAIERWYRRQAMEHFAARVAHFAPRVGATPKKIAIRAPRTRWGSCTSRGTVSFNWRLLLLPAALADYVVVHELCHLRVPNHSARFWTEVARVIPDWSTYRTQLRAAGRRPLWTAGNIADFPDI